MITTDLTLLLSLSVFLLVWWIPSFKHQISLLVVCGVVALLAGFWGVFDYRWQNAGGVLASVILLIAVMLGRVRGNKANVGIPWVSGFCVTLLVMVSFVPLYLFPVPDIPAPSGKFPVGTRSFELSDPSRPGVLGAKDDEPRRLLIRTWYPAGDINGLDRRPYYTELEAKTTARRLGELMGAPFLFQYIKHSVTNSYPDAPVLDGAKELPVVMYSHGYMAQAGQNTALMEELASHGYVVYSIQHSYDASDTVFPNGDIIPMSSALLESLTDRKGVSDAVKMAYIGATFEKRYAGYLQAGKESVENKERISTQSAKIWREDRIFVLDSLQQKSVPESAIELVAASDFSRTGEMGMSFGGSTTGGVCMVDSRCAAAVNLDGGGFHSTPVGKNIPVPIMMLYSDFKYIVQYAGGDENSPARGFNDFSYERHELAGLREDVYRLMVKDVKHLGVSDLTLFARNPVSQLLFGSIDAQVMIRIQNEFVRGFFDTHLREREVGFPQAQYAKFEQWVERTDISDVRDWWIASHPEDISEQVIFETNRGDIELALYPRRAPQAARQFLNYVSSGHYDGASFYRVARRGGGDNISVVQGGLLAHAMAKDSDAYGRAKLPLPQLKDESTDQTGIRNERGTVAYFRLAPGGANSEFFINIQDNPTLDAGNSFPNSDWLGYTTFGRIVRGMRVLEEIQFLPADVPIAIDGVEGKILSEPVTILRAYRLKTNGT